MKSIKHISVFICCIAFSLHLFSQSPSGAVCISEEGVTPNASAILDIQSNSKGVLFPRMSFEAATNIENKANGLTIFVTDTTKLGYWYWNANESKWIQLRGEDTAEQDIEAPYGGIILYSGIADGSVFNGEGKGIEGTKMEGWHICNGNNGTPDLSGRFIMGTTDNTREFGGSDTLKLLPNNMPKHRHETNTINGEISAHEHTVTDQVHYHFMDVVWKKILGRKRKKHIEVRKKGDNKVEFLREEANDVGIGGEIQMKEATDYMTFRTDDLNKEVKIENTGGGKGIDNRPSFYVLLYIMRIDTGIE